MILLSERIFNVHQQFMSRTFSQARGTLCDPRSLHELGECLAYFTKLGGWFAQTDVSCSELQCSC